MLVRNKGRETERTPLCQNKILFKNNKDLLGELKGPGEKGTKYRAQGFGLQVLALGRHCRDLSGSEISETPSTGQIVIQG